MQLPKTASGTNRREPILGTDNELEFDIIGDGRGIMSIRHDDAPRFTAKWATGDSVPAKFSGPLFTDKGADDGGEDNIHIYDIEWLDDQPGPEETQTILEQAALAIDLWIVYHL